MMNWLFTAKFDEDARGNWSKPFLKNVFSSFNTSVNGPQRFGIGAHLSSYIEDTFSYNTSQAAQFGVLTAVFLILFLNGLFKKDPSAVKTVFTLHWKVYLYAQICLSVALHSLLLLIFPLSLLTFSIFFLYKTFVRIVLRCKHGAKFVSMMDSTDTVWAVEEENAKSIINVISMVRPIDSSTTEGHREDILSKLRKIFLIMHPESVCPKIFYKRSSFMGYHYWLDNDLVKIEDHIKLMEIDPNIELTEDALQCFVENELNACMPCENTASWEILVSDRPMKGSRHYPILFRIHHTLGDGVALLSLLLNTIGSTDLDYEKPNFKKTVEKPAKSHWKDVNFKTAIRSFLVYTKKIALLICQMPVSLVNQATRPPDSNILHGPELSGDKVMAWTTDEQYGESILAKIKRMKRRMPGVTFSELFLTALSASFLKYFSKESKSPPELITTVVPIRMNNCSFSKTPNENLPVKLENKFSVAMLTIPIVNENLNRNCSILKRLIAVREETNKLRQSADLQVNYWLMKAGGYFFPESILKPMLTSVQASLVVSNLPGPSDVTLYGGYKLDKLAFFVPNRGTTGVGVTIISCNDRINLGLMADHKLLDSSKDGSFILKNVLSELDNMERLLSKMGDMLSIGAYSTYEK